MSDIDFRQYRFCLIFCLRFCSATSKQCGEENSSFNLPREKESIRTSLHLANTTPTQKKKKLTKIKSTSMAILQSKLGMPDSLRVKEVWCCCFQCVTHMFGLRNHLNLINTLVSHHFAAIELKTEANIFPWIIRPSNGLWLRFLWDKFHQCTY